MKLTKKVEKELGRLLEWAHERQRIYLRRKAGEPWPWTKDPILQRYRFCNVYREQDKETVWLREHWREPYAQHSSLWFACALFRQINWSPTLEEIGFPETWHPAKICKIMHARKARGEKLYTSAYMLNARGCDKGASKVEYTVHEVLGPLWRRIFPYKQVPYRDSLEKAWEWFMQFNGFGPFLSYEVVTDLRHTRYLCKASDIYTWANAGPGAKRGLNRIFKRPVRQGLNAAKALEEMQTVFLWMDRARDPRVLPTFEMREVEHLLCEWDKNCRAQENPGCGLEAFRPKVTLV